MNPIDMSMLLNVYTCRHVSISYMPLKLLTISGRDYFYKYEVDDAIKEIQHAANSLGK
jgi:hypothetical protein